MCTCQCRLRCTPRRRASEAHSPRDPQRHSRHTLSLMECTHSRPIQCRCRCRCQCKCKCRRNPILPNPSRDKFCRHSRHSRCPNSRRSHNRCLSLRARRPSRLLSRTREQLPLRNHQPEQWLCPACVQTRLARGSLRLRFSRSLKSRSRRRHYRLEASRTLRTWTRPLPALQQSAAPLT